MKKDKSNSNQTMIIEDSFNNKKTTNNNNHSTKKSHISKYITQEIFEYGTDKKIPYNLVRSKRRKTSELIIENENEITLRVPFDKPKEEIKEMIQKKIQWILRKQDEIKRTKPEIKEDISYLPYSKLPYLGNNYLIEIRNLDSFINDIEKVEIEDNKLLFYLKDIPTEYNQYDSSLIAQISDIDILKKRIKKIV